MIADKALPSRLDDLNLAQSAVNPPQAQDIGVDRLVTDRDGTASDISVTVVPVESAEGHIRPYPKQWEQRTALRDGTAIFIRPLRPEDEPLYKPFFSAVTKQDVRLRFFGPVKEFDHAFLARFIQIDYITAMAFIALDEGTGRMLGVVRLHTNPDGVTGEYAILIRSDLKDRGLGWLLMKTMIDYAPTQGIRVIEGQVLRENSTMLTMCKELGFRVEPDPVDFSVCLVELRTDKF
jgi:acetyltransferase